MTPERWQQIEELFHQADQQPAGERQAFLIQACNGDGDLRGEVEALLQSADENGQVLEQSVGTAARAVLGDEPLPARQQIGAYEIIRLLGEGGMGVVYLARRADSAYQQNVAIKIIRPSFALHNVVERFRSERQILANLIHPNIARLLDGGVMVSGQPYLVMEYLDGPAIDIWCQKHSATIREKLAMFRSVCAGVQYAHQNLVVHRDIKPANILVCSDGTPKLLDFGLARVLDMQNAPGAPGQTRWTERLMTPEYASPEQVMGQPITTATDVYALGVVLYELLSGERPFDLSSSSPIELQRVITKEATRPSIVCLRTYHDRRMADSLRGDLDNIVLKAMQKEPARRYATAGALSEDIGRFLNGFPVQAQPDSWNYRTRKFVGRHRLGVAAAALFVILLLGFGAGMGALAQRASTQRDRAETISSFLVRLFRAADPDGVSSRDVTVREMLDRGVGSVDQLSAEPGVQSKLLNTFALVYESLGAYTQSRELVERSEAIEERLSGRENLEVADRLKTMADMDRRSTKYSRGEAEARKSLAIRLKKLGPKDFLVAESRNTLAIILQETGQLQEAEQLFLEVLAAPDLHGDTPHLNTAVLSNLGALYRSLGDYSKAEQYLQQCVAIRRKELHGDHPRLALVLAKLAGVQEDEGKVKEAEAAARESLAMRERLFGPIHSDVARSRVLLASLERDQGRYAEAAANLSTAAAAYRQKPGTGEDLTSLHFQQGLLWDAQGNFTDAETTLRQCLSDRLARFGNHHITVAKTEVALARVLLNEQRIPEAREAAQAALPMISGTLPPAEAVRREVNALLSRCDQKQARDTAVRQLSSADGARPTRPLVLAPR